ncbi:MAG: cupin domain-containing protein [Thermoplasmata archaeon]|nr:cupin domain-containing protein [Thermoplasmata archaeon]
MVKAILMKAGESLRDVRQSGCLFRNVLKTDKLEANLTHLLPGTKTNSFKHKGQEFKLMMKGEVEYKVGEQKFIMQEGDMLFHHSEEKHSAKNIGKEEAIFITISTPPTFTLFEK